MPRISVTFPEFVLYSPPGTHTKAFLTRLPYALAERLGEEFREKLGIRGKEDIWVNIGLGSFSNKHAVFGNIYMLDKPGRTPEVRKEFGDATASHIAAFFKEAFPNSSEIGIDMPIQLVQSLDYIEKDPPPED